MNCHKLLFTFSILILLLFQLPFLAKAQLYTSPSGNTTVVGVNAGYSPTNMLTGGPILHVRQESNDLSKIALLKFSTFNGDGAIGLTYNGTHNADMVFGVNNGFWGGTPETANVIERMRIRANGRLGIGTTNPQTGLDVRANNGTITGNSLYFYGSGNHTDNIPHSRLIEYYGMRFNAQDSRWVFSSKPSILIGYAPAGQNWGDGSLFVQENVNIGTTSPEAGYRLSVKGRIKAQEIKVTNDNWADYVFEPTYQLPALAQVESFIKENKHLPDVPSAKQVAKEGIDLGKMDATLLKKIEELTLYVIEQQKVQQEQGKKIAELQEANARLQAQQKQTK